VHGRVWEGRVKNASLRIPKGETIPWMETGLFLRESHKPLLFPVGVSFAGRITVIPPQEFLL